MSHTMIAGPTALLVRNGNLCVMVTAIGHWLGSKKKVSGRMSEKHAMSGKESICNPNCLVSLQKLKMSFCSLDLCSLFKDIKDSLFCESIELLDISGAKVDRMGLQVGTPL